MGQLDPAVPILSIPCLHSSSVWLSFLVCLVSTATWVITLFQNVKELGNVQWGHGCPSDIFQVYYFHLFIHSANRKGVLTMVPGTAIGSVDSAVNEKTKSLLSQSFF